MTIETLVALAAVPFVVLVATSFMKFSIVMAVLARGFGVQVPSKLVGAALALLLTGFVMAPVAERVSIEVGKEAARAGGVTWAMLARASDPVREFLIEHTRAEDRARFVESARKLRKGSDADAVRETDGIVLMTAFAAAELKAAFLLAFLVVLPFLVIDLLVGTTLAQIGMTGLSPEWVGLPFKLLLFAVADGWELLFRGLVASYS